MDLNATNAEKFSFLENNVKDLRSRIDAISLKQKETTKIQLANLEEKVDAQVEVLLEAVQDAQKSFKEYIVENDSNIREEVAQQMTEKFEACDIAYDHSFHLYTQRTVEEGNRLANFVDTTIASTKEATLKTAYPVHSESDDDDEAGYAGDETGYESMDSIVMGYDAEMEDYIDVDVPPTNVVPSYHHDDNYMVSDACATNGL